MEANGDRVAAVPRGFIVAVVNISHSIAHLNMQGMSVLYPVLREHFAFGYMGIAFLSVIPQMVTGPMQITFGVLTRFVRRLHILGIGTALAFLGTVVMAISQSYGHLLAGRVIRGLGTSPYHPVGGAIMASMFPHDRAKALGLHQTLGNMGSLMAPLIVGALLHFLGWRSVLLILGFPLLLASIPCFFLKETPGEVDPEISAQRRGRLGLHEYKAVFRDRNALILGLVMMVGAGGRGTGAIRTYLAVLLVDRYGISVSYAALFCAAYAFGAVIGPLAMGWLADRSSSRLAVRLNLLLSAVFLMLILTPATPGIILGTFVFLTGIFIPSRNTLLQSLLIQSGPQDARIDTVLSLYFTIGAISGPIWTVLTGVLVDQVGIEVALGTMAASFIVGMGLLSLIRVDRPTK
jgi:FSR family fosmidomycin resistance protein-like MFS transporter